MKTIGRVESVWRYPVKSMRGAEVAEVFVGFAGVYCDRLYAFVNEQSRPGLPYLTAREQRQMLRFRPFFRQPENAVAPPNLIAAQNMPPGATPLYADPGALAVDVDTPDGATLAIEDPSLMEQLCAGLSEKPRLRLRRSERALTDCRPVSLISRQTVAKLGEDIGSALDARRFRANFNLDLTNAEGFAEDQLVGRQLRIGDQVTLALLQRDPRCMMITLDPDTAEKTPAVLKAVAQRHDGFAGVYAAVLVEGMVRQGDKVGLLD